MKTRRFHAARLVGADTLIHNQPILQGGETCARASVSLRWHLIATFGLIAAACGDDESSSDTTTAPVETGGTETTIAPVDTGGTDTTMGGGGEALNVGLAFDTGGRGDGTFNDSAAAGADKATTELGVTVDELEATTAEDRTPNLETLTANGNNPIIAVGFAFGDALADDRRREPRHHVRHRRRLHRERPGQRHLPRLRRAGGFVPRRCRCGTEERVRRHRLHRWPGDRPHQEFEAGYTAGAQVHQPRHRDQRRSTSVPPATTPPGASPDKAKEIANGWYADGADVIYTAAGGSGQGTIEAAVEADKWAIGVDSDQ